MLEGVHKYTKIGFTMGIKIGSDIEKSGWITYLLVMMRVRLLQKIDLQKFTDRNLFKNERA